MTVVNEVDGVDAGLEIHLSTKGLVYQISRCSCDPGDATFTAYESGDLVLLRSEASDPPEYSRAEIALDRETILELADAIRGGES